MTSKSPYQGTLQYVRARWPTYLLLYGGGAALALAITFYASDRGLWSFSLFGLAVLLILVYFFAASLWAAHQKYDLRQNRPSHVLFELGKIQPTDEFVHVSLGVRQIPVRLSRRLTGGHLRAIDVYNPQLAPSRALARQRRPLAPTQPDPRLTWLEGSIDLLPVPDHSTPVVTASHILHELWQEGDRELLLREIYRILKPGGRLLLAEPARTKTNLLLRGPGALRLQRLAYWRRLLQNAGFKLTQERNVVDMYVCFCVEKPLSGEIQQLTLDLGI